MTKEEFDEYVRNRFCEQIEWFDKKAVKYKKCHQRLTFASIALSASAPALIAIFEQARAIPIGTTALLTIVTGTMAAYSFQEQWLKYRVMVSSLRREKHLYDAGIKDYKDADPEQRRQLFVERIEDLLTAENKNWLSERKESE